LRLKEAIIKKHMNYDEHRKLLGVEKIGAKETFNHEACNIEEKLRYNLYYLNYDGVNEIIKSHPNLTAIVKTSLVIGVNIVDYDSDSFAKFNKFISNLQVDVNFCINILEDPNIGDELKV